MSSTQQQSYCPRCRVWTYYPAGNHHYKWCDEILLPLNSKGEPVTPPKQSELLSIVIMAHPRRRDMAEEVAKMLECPIVWDEKNNLWDTCSRAWKHGASIGSEWVLILQDDVIPTSDFRAKVETFIKTHSERDCVFAFYTGAQSAGRITAAQKAGRDYFEAGFIFNEVAICMRSTHVGSMVRWCDEREAKNDQYITQWMRIARLKCVHSIPSFVDHREGESIYRSNENRPNVSETRKAFVYEK